MTLDPQIVPALAGALAKKGYSDLTEVQQAVLTAQPAGADLLVSAQTGSGKTVAFGMAFAPVILDGAEAFGLPELPLALVVAPTRELALQVERELVWLFDGARGRVSSCVGGMDPRAERRALERGAHIVVGTPGRLRDHIERGALDLSSIRAVVLDEADEMLDFGFREDLEFILDAAPTDRQTLMFSATVPRTITSLARRYQKNAQRISTVGEKEQHVDIFYRALAVAPSDRENAIINTLRFYDAESAIVFCATRQAVNRLSSRFGNRGFSVVALSGELSQTERTHALQSMRDGRARVCVATDVAARGIDLPKLGLVIHADLPTNGEMLLHRSGRTGRAGRKGVCALIVPHTRRSRANRLLRDAKVQAEWSNAPSLDDIKKQDRERLLSDPALTETYDEDALAFAGELLSRYGPEQIAAAFLSRRQSDMPAAEELLDAPSAGEAPRSRHEPFGDSVWFKLSAGRKQNAEPRWLLPLVCRLGHITKREVGSIKIGDTDSRVEIAAHVANRFMDAVKAAGGGEKSIRITRDDGAGDKKPSSSDRKSAGRSSGKPAGKSFQRRPEKTESKSANTAEDRKPPQAETTNADRGTRANAMASERPGKKSARTSFKDKPKSKAGPGKSKAGKGRWSAERKKSARKARPTLSLPDAANQPPKKTRKQTQPGSD